VRVRYTRTFQKRFAKELPDKQQEKCVRLIEILAQDPFSPRLHTKSLSGKLAGIYSFRISREYRVLFRIDAPDVVTLVDVGHRKNIYRS
jgi:addiction module RelE/StbE family toxin